MGNKKFRVKRADAGLLFLTAVTYKRIPIFGQRQPAEIFFRELDFYREKFDFKLYGYVLMPDHFHLVLDFPVRGNFRDFLRDFKSSVAKLVIGWAKRSENKSLLHKLGSGANPQRHRDSRYRIFQPGSYVRPIATSRMFRQKLDYIHANPLQARLVEHSIEFPYSSLRNYELGKGVISIDPHRIILS